MLKSVDVDLAIGLVEKFNRRVGWFNWFVTLTLAGGIEIIDRRVGWLRNLTGENRINKFFCFC